MQRTEIKQLISAGDYLEALERAEQWYLASNQTDAYNQSILLSGNWYRIQRDWRRELVTREDRTTAEQTVIKEFLHLIDLPDRPGRTEAVQAQIDAGHEKILREDFAAAEQHFQKAIQRVPDDLEANFLLGTSLTALGRFVEANLRFSYLLEHLSPNNPRALTQRGNNSFILGQIEKACSDWKLVQQEGFPYADQMLLDHCQNSK
ncbi:MAG: tetratricopeptide repeat protein [Bacteroidota bacterium]